ncbi:HNH endonuclease signature motif containing protein [Corynebacterium aurimucosum]|uniref:HNH nuclease domain-containing protein n=1 Tax=Corynebacterium aurimucosum (strain ATCC 700975 / DSM 44827 / CIP 107346 / CN-1) TaxID=548476 RepID=C3PFE9_CORA7|nr:HNH endonuclease signature motif containing protein [Corynebacterium aurimucosum]ACP32553.1 hypothetical protein cauri_0956 [Corynebacterium aurimucosum ATCC 700975]QQU93271.1 HNH endonuclease [Corynebacterium aurimucosum]
MTTAAATRPSTAFFSITNPNNPHAIARAAARRSIYDTWQAAMPSLQADINTTALSLVAAWSLPEGHIKAGLRAIHRLDSLPKVKAIQDTHCLLDIESLIAIDQPMSALTALTDETLDLIDTVLADFFTPTKANQAFPTRSQIRRKVRDLCKTLDDSIAFRDTRPKDAYRFSSNGTTAWLELQVKEDTGIKLDAFIRKTAAQHDLTIPEAVIKLLSGEIKPPATVVLHTYQACDIENAPTYVEGFGWRQEAMPHDKTRDLTGDIPEADGYQPGIIMRKHVEGRDGTCRVGGCEEPAFLTQLDHRHNWADGGPTHPKNLACLCQGHHNMKTDGTLKYLLDPYSGDVIWLFVDGTWTITEAEGPLAPKQKRWAQTVAQHITATRKRIREEAQHLKQELDDYAQQAKAKAEAQTDTDSGEDIPF